MGLASLFLVIATNTAQRRPIHRSPSRKGGVPVQPRGRDLVEMLVEGALALRRCEALLVRAEAACIDFLCERERARELGCSCTAVLARERLGVSLRTVHERVRLHRALGAWPELARAFHDGRVSVCQVVALADVPAAERERWLAEATLRTVRELKRAIRDSKEEAPGRLAREPAESEPSEERAFRFDAPVGFVGVWREMQELARKVLGYQAPRAQCLQAILAEAGGYRGNERSRAGTEKEGADRGPGGPQAGPRAARLGGPHRTTRPPLIGSTPLAAGRRALRWLEQLETTLSSLRPFVSAGAPREAAEAFHRYEELQRRHRPLRLLLARILRCLNETRAAEQLGYPRLCDFIEERLHLSERTARHLVREAFLFGDAPMLARAYEVGALGSLAMTVIHRVARGPTQGAWLQRAREVTLRQLEREADLVELLRLADPELAARFPGPLPAPGLERALAERLGANGRKSTIVEIDAELARRRIGPVGSSATKDPARDPDLMRRLERLVAARLGQTWDEAPRQTFALRRREIRVHWVLPAEVTEDLQRAVDAVRRRQGRVPPQAMPVWVALVQIFEPAAATWNAHDPETEPVWRRILERDDYLCATPGCTRRGTLVVHHVWFRSHGGCDRAWNLVTLCHACHAHLVHESRVRVRGRAPGSLRWEVGGRRGRGVLLVLHGDRILWRRAWRA